MALNINDGRKVVTAAGTAEALESSSRGVEMVIIVAETNNTGVMAVGGSGVIASLTTRTGVPLLAGEPVTLFNVDLGNVYVDATVNGDGVTYVYIA